MIHNEMSFLFDSTIQPAVGNPIRRNIGGTPPSIGANWKMPNENKGDIFGVLSPNTSRIFKDPVNGANGKNVIDYVNSTVYARDRLEVDPYISLLTYFNGSGSQKTGPISMMLKPADFVYLKDLGVYPINRLVILRRFPDGCIVPNNLTLFKQKPIATAIGWIKMDDANKDLFSISFSERWVDSTDTLDKVIQKIMKEQFGIKTEMFLPIPAWSQGFLFGMLNKMGLTKDFDSKNVPTGDPNVLRQAKMRDIESQSLSSDFKINFETAYEQKYINGVDPGSAFQDILSNLARIGTSDQKFILNSDTNKIFSKFVDAVNSPAVGGANAWIEFGKVLIKGFIDAISSLFVDVEGFANQYITQTELNTSDRLKESTTTSNEKGYTFSGYVDKPGNKIYKKSGNFYSLDKSGNYNEIPKSALNNLFGDTSAAKTAAVALKSFIEGGLDTLLAGSVYRYRWPLRGSIGLMSGLSTTPWHLTVGNPFSPILSMGNVYVDNVDIKFSSEMGFQDMPKSINVNIDLKQGRPLGKWEIERLFNNQYGRIYSKPSDKKSAVQTGGEINGPPNMTDEQKAEQLKGQTGTNTDGGTNIPTKQAVNNTLVNQQVAVSDETNRSNTQRTINTKGATTGANASNWNNLKK